MREYLDGNRATFLAIQPSLTLVSDALLNPIMDIMPIRPPAVRYGLKLVYITIDWKLIFNSKLQTNCQNKWIKYLFSYHLFFTHFWSLNWKSLETFRRVKWKLFSHSNLYEFFISFKFKFNFKSIFFKSIQRFLWEKVKIETKFLLCNHQMWCSHELTHSLLITTLFWWCLSQLL